MAFCNCSRILSTTRHTPLNPDSLGRISEALLNLLLQAQATLTTSEWTGQEGLSGNSDLPGA